MMRCFYFGKIRIENNSHIQKLHKMAVPTSLSRWIIYGGIISILVKLEKKAELFYWVI